MTNHIESLEKKITVMDSVIAGYGEEMYELRQQIAGIVEKQEQSEEPAIIEEPQDLLYEPQGILQIVVKRVGNGWSATIHDNGYVDKSDFNLADVSGETINGRTAIEADGVINSSTRIPPASDQSIDWNFALERKSGGIVNNSQFILSDNHIAARIVGS